MCIFGGLYLKYVEASAARRVLEGMILLRYTPIC